MFEFLQLPSLVASLDSLPGAEHAMAFQRTWASSSSFAVLSTLGQMSLPHPILLYVGCVVAVIGLALALPRKGLSFQALGAVVGGAGVGLMLLALGLAYPEHLPNYNFYIFSLIALGASLRVISHPRPVYAALYFILTILASCGLYVLLSAEFMAFALVIVYAGAILITYLFVIMLATETPTADAVEALSEYDRYSREPMFASIVGFIMLAGLTTMLAGGSAQMTPAIFDLGAKRLELVPRRVQQSLRDAGLMGADEQIARIESQAIDEPTKLDMQFTARPGGKLDGHVGIAYGEGFKQTRIVTTEDPRWPTDLKLTNPEGVGFTLLADHPGGIEVAGVILLMAMLGAVVLARRKIELDDQAKLEILARRGMLGGPTKDAEGRASTDDRMSSASGGAKLNGRSQHGTASHSGQQAMAGRVEVGGGEA